MNCPERTDSLPNLLLTAACVLLLLVGGCAKKPWLEDIGPDQGKAVEQVFLAMQQRDAACPPCLDGDAVVSMENHLETRSLSGYLMCGQPDSVKFIASNPLGQPLFAVATDGSRFTSLDIMKRTALSGRLDSYALLHDIPPAFFSGSWGEWLSGRVDQGQKGDLVFRADQQERGTWVSFSVGEGEKKTTTHLLIDTGRSLLLTRILEDHRGSILAEISYDDWQDAGGCRVPTQITMSKLAFGGEVSLRLSDSKAGDLCGPRDFVLRIPPGYTRNLLP
jgi:hypothetical protein